MVIDTNYIYSPVKTGSWRAFSACSGASANPLQRRTDTAAQHCRCLHRLAPVGDNLTLDLSIASITDEYYRVAFQELSTGAWKCARRPLPFPGFYTGGFDEQPSRQ